MFGAPSPMQGDYGFGPLPVLLYEQAAAVAGKVPLRILVGQHTPATAEDHPAYTTSLRSHSTSWQASTAWAWRA